MLPTLQKRFPRLATEYVTALTEEHHDRECLNEVQAAAEVLRAEGYRPPTYEELAAGARPPNPPPNELDPGEWQHGWQYFASSAREKHYLQNTVLPRCSRSEQALMRSQAGRNSARALTAVPSDESLKLCNERFQFLLCRRLRLPLLLTRRCCDGCGAQLDSYGDHLLACMRTGRVQARAKPVERAWARVFREAGATTHEQHLLRNTTFPVDPSDQRRIDVLVTGSFLDRPWFCDATVRSPLNCKGEPQPKAACTNGATFEKARKDKVTKYEDVDKSPLAELVVLACEVGGCWNDKALEVVRRLAKNKVQNAHELLRRSAELAWTDRWWALLGVAVQNAVAASVLAPGGKGLVLDDKGVDTPDLSELLDGQRWSATL